MFAELHQTCMDRYGSADTSVDLATWIVENTTLNKKPFSFKQYPFQEAIAADEHTNLSCEKCSQVGLALALDTPIPTPTGWTTMGELQVGDQVFDERGIPCDVEYVSPIFTDHACYAIRFDTGETILADAGHRWYVEANRSFNLSGDYSGRGRPGPNAEMFKEGVLDTATIAKFQNNGIRNRFAIPNTQPLVTDLVSNPNLPLDPYLLGTWLGDGNTHAAVVTTHSEDLPHLKSELESRGFVVALSSERGDTKQVRVEYPGQKRPGRGTPNSVSWTLSKMGLLGNSKFVPDQYLRASRAQRLDLLRGLMDTDGSITKNGRCSFYNSNDRLVSAAQELAHSLGFKTRTRWRLADPSVLKNGHTINPTGPVAEVSFVAYAEDAVFLLPRKRSRLGEKKNGRSSEALRRRIVDVQQIEPVPVRCVSVSSPSHLFLCGKGMIPTHNTEVQIRKFFALLRRNTNISGIFSLPNEKMYKRIYSARMKPILDADAVFNPTMGTPPIRNMGITQIVDSFGYITGCTEGDATSISADFLMHDELDLSPPDMIGLFQSRLQNSDMKMTQSFSTPSFLDYGINRQYQLSDQREYMLQCEGCNHWQTPRFDFPFLHIPNFRLEVEKITDIHPEQIVDMDLDGIYVRCEKCQTRLDLSNSSQREWVSTFPSRTSARGYKVRPFSTGRIAPGYVFTQLSKYQTNDFLRGFYNTVLGEPFTESAAQIQKHEIEAVMAQSGAIPNISQDTPVFLGLDMGQICHLTLHCDGEDSNPQFILFEQVPVFHLAQRLTELREIYGIVQGCVDRYPYTPTVDSFRDETAGLIMPVAYGGRAYISPHYDETKSVDYYNANRTSALDRVRAGIVNRSVVLAGYGAYRETIITHLRDMVRDEKPEAEPEWKKLNGNDHFFHSMALSLLARRVCEHVYSSDTKSLLSNAIVTSVNLPHYVNNLSNNSAVNKFSRLK